MDHRISTDRACSADSAWDDVVRIHAGRVYRHAYRLTGNRPDAEDLAQEVFVRVFRHLHGYTSGTFEGWLYRITQNLFLDQVRRRHGIRFEPFPDAFHLTTSPAPDQDLEHRMFDADVRSALDELSPGALAAVVLHDVDGLTYDEIAAILGVRCGTVASRLHRARAQLRAALVHRSPRGGPGRVAA
ncbi:sigma-70 family RNA polymerase sigma factor [Kribbella sp. NPDC050124]|uniref:sigma-70 family RNA polymerase sigma factor n=1 Tax=Kribbella sp. NPDC050124 TaxID=3364114 RepID=UPI0037B262D4